ncbi:hypothetical protein [Bradyrhizobium sp. RDI18]|uniref:hypothetical protein n=1 Tax=Bradyrhizobium sp. RDI18 TaxID=3367400 RepID=UPI0037229AD8
MRQLNTIARGFLSPPVLLSTVWALILVIILIGPIHYPSLPSMSTFLLIVVGLVLFSCAHCAGAWSFARSLGPGLRQSATPEVLNLTVGAASIAGLVGIALIALDRTVFSGMSNSDRAALLRCAPALVDFIQIKRTPLLYLGYLSFSFGFVSLALFLLRGEDIKGWAVYPAQLSILSPVGYAILYSGRMPILLMLALILSVVVVRLAWRLPPLPRGHHLLVKVMVVSVLFGVYVNAMWSSRQNSCAEMEAVVRELQTAKEQHSDNRQSLPKRAKPIEKIEALRKRSDAADEVEANNVKETLVPSNSPQLGIDAARVSKMFEDVRPRVASAGAPEVGPFLNNMRQSWKVAPRQYVVSAHEAGYLSSSAFRALLSNHFYLTHGVRTLGVIWQSRAELSPSWGVYEIGILSPISRIFFPANQLLTTMNNELIKADIYGFFPTVWGAALVDFGAWGAAIYIVFWGFCGGWAYCGTTRSTLVTPPLLLTFTIASIVLSPIQGPLGISNSALVLLSMLTIGGIVDTCTLRDKPRTDVST